LVRPEGFEPSTNGLKVRCSTRLSYGRIDWRGTILAARRGVNSSEHS
jgi:hypothetical protein